MQIQQIKIKDLKLAEYNPRKISDADLEALKNSIREFGFVEPIVANKNNQIVGGHQRVKAAQALGIESVPVFYVDLPAEKEKILNLALNRIHGDWDEGKLAKIIDELKDLPELDLSGFNDGEITSLLDSISKNKEGDFDVDKAVEEIKEPQSRPGEVYELGRHRLMCGDSASEDDVKKLLNGVKMDLVFTDPPYNVSYKSRGQNRKTWADAYGDDDYSENDFEEFCYKAFKNFYQNLKRGGVYYISSGYSSLPAFWKALRRLNLKPSGVIVWDKLSPGMGWSDYWYQHEQIITGFNASEDDQDVYDYLIYGFDDKSKRYFKKQKRLSDIWRVAREARQSYVHPTQKPIKLIENALFNSSKRNDLVLDLFGGSGSTLIACEKNDRIAFLMERSPLFCDVIRKRYEEYTNKN